LNGGQRLSKGVTLNIKRVNGRVPYNGLSRDKSARFRARILQRKIARFELFEEIRKKAAGLLNLEYESPEFDEND
jgi:hypothetical protein